MCGECSAADICAALRFKLVLDVDLIDHECSEVLNTVGLLADGTTALSWNVQQFGHWFKVRFPARYMTPRQAEWGRQRQAEAG